MLELAVAAIIVSFAVVVAGTELSLSRRRRGHQLRPDGTPIHYGGAPLPLWTGWDAGGLGSAGFGGGSDGGGLGAGDGGCGGDGGAGSC